MIIRIAPDELITAQLLCRDNHKILIERLLLIAKIKLLGYDKSPDTIKLLCFEAQTYFSRDFCCEHIPDNLEEQLKTPQPSALLKAVSV